jgi:ataxin-10
VSLIFQEVTIDIRLIYPSPDEVVTPHQTTLLKIVDSYLQSIQINATAPPQGIMRTHRTLSPMLANCFFELSTYACLAVERALALPSTASDPSTAISVMDPEGAQEAAQSSPPAELDVMLPKVCETLVLVTQCIVTVTLGADELEPTQERGTSEYDLKTFFNERRSFNRGLVECLIGMLVCPCFRARSHIPRLRELLHLLDLFLPRINFGKPVTSSSAQGTPTQQSTADGTGFQYLKRDLVRLLGILSHGSKAVQNRARDCGGIEVVMNLCVVDERNPCEKLLSVAVVFRRSYTHADLREHAIFTLHCLLEDNPENQAVVNAMQPNGQWGENGMLQETPRAVH